MRWGAGRRRMITETVLILLGGYLVLCAAVWLLQDQLVFPGAGRSAPLPAAPRVEVEWLSRPSGERFRIARASTAEPKGVLLSFVGNGEDLSAGIVHAVDLRRYGLESWVSEYPGYGESEGRPGVHSILEVAVAAAETVAARARELDLPFFVCGSSLGSFSAVHVATRFEVQGLLLRAPPTSIRSAGRTRFPWLPVGLLLRHGFDNLAKAPEVRCKVLVLHGELDTVVPPGMGRELCEAFPGPARFLLCPGHGHNDLPLGPDGEFTREIREFFGA